MKRILILIALAAVLAGAAWGATAWVAQPEPVYWLSIDQHHQYQGPSSIQISAYRLDDYWLWYRTSDGREYTINVHGRNIIIASDLATATLSEEDRKANINGVGSAGK